MIDLDRDLRIYASQMEDSMGPIDLESMRSYAPRGPRASRRRLVVALAAALATSLVVVAVVLLDPFGTEAPFVEEPTTVSTTTTQATPTTTAAAPTVPSTTAPPPDVAVGRSAFTWERITDPVLAEGAAARAVIRHRGEYLAVGAFEAEGALWRSADGRTWTRNTDPAFAGAELFDVMPYRDGLVVIGNTIFDPENPDRAPVIALSENGETWERIDTSDPVTFVPTGMDWTGPLQSVAVLGDRIIVAGSHIWISDDARTWTLAIDLGERGTAGGVAASANGIVVVGSDFPNAVVWYSTNGDEWTEVPVSTPGRMVSSMLTVAATPEGFVAGGLVGNDPGTSPQGGWAAADAAVWVSPNGVTWRSVPGEEFGGPYGQWIHGFANTSDALVAVGIEMYSNWNSATGVVWESEDGGSTWQRVEDPEHRFGNVFEGWAEMNDVVFHDGRFLAVGSFGKKYQPEESGVWLGNPSK